MYAIVGRGLKPAIKLLAPAALIWVCAGCASSQTQVQKAAKDWCMTIRGSQVIPVYPLTEDIQPGDIFLVQVPIQKQQELYRGNGFLALDNHLDRLNPTGYERFYQHSFFEKGVTNDLPRDWIRPPGTNQSWYLAPHVAFPTYSFSIRNGAGLSLAVPIEGVPVGLSLMGSDAANGMVEIKDAYTMGVDTISLYDQLLKWAANNADFLAFFAPGNNQTNYLRVITRIYATGKMSVSLLNASSRSGGVDVGVPKPVNFASVSLPTNPTNTAGTTLQNFNSASNAPSQTLQAIMAAKDASGNILPGGSLRVVAASSRAVSMDETFSKPVVFGYLGFDCAIADNGKLGAPIPTYARLQKDYQLNQFKEFRESFKGQTEYFKTIKEEYNKASAGKKLAILTKAKDLGLINGDVVETDFIENLRQAVDGTRPELTPKFQALSDFSVQTK